MPRCPCPTKLVPSFGLAKSFQTSGVTAVPALLDWPARPSSASHTQLPICPRKPMRSPTPLTRAISGVPYRPSSYSPGEP